MNRRDVTAACAGTALLHGLGTGALMLMSAGPAAAVGVAQDEAASGIRAALERGAAAAIDQLGRSDGFLNNPAVRIELPGFLSDIARTLRTLGQGRKVDDLVLAMNRAAEAAVPQARTLFVSTIKAISIEDALRLVRGSDTAVTEFFVGKTRPTLTERFLPVVTQATEQVQLAERYNAVASRAASLGLLKGDDVSIQRYVTGKALDGLYRMVGEEEKRIRANPLQAGSAILARVFGR